MTRDQVQERTGGERPAEFALPIDSVLPQLGLYGASALIVIAVFGAGFVVLRPGTAADPLSSEAEDAVLVDLPPTLASSAPKQDADDGPEQAASTASVAQQAVERPSEEKPPEDEPPAPDRMPPEPPPPPSPDAAATLERTAPQPVAPSPQVAATAAPEQDAQAPSGADLPQPSMEAEADEDRSRASAHAMALWQKGMMSRIVAARAGLRRATSSSGTVVIAFAIDGKGALVEERVDRSSGNAALDHAALALIRQAAPFPPPPPGARGKDLSFTVPVQFRR